MPIKNSSTYAVQCRHYIKFIYIESRIFVVRSVRCHTLLPKPNPAVLSPLVWDAVLDSLYRIQTRKFSFLETNLTSDTA
jgi:hypothetical protein